LLEETAQQELDEAKLQGLEATRKAINTWNHNKEFKWALLPVSAETANKLLQGKFKTFDELKSSADEDSTRFDNKIEILFREIYNENKKDYDYIIETIFIDE
jgi:outer membrane cobalamin receptor